MMLLKQSIVFGFSSFLMCLFRSEGEPVSLDRLGLAPVEGKHRHKQFVPNVKTAVVILADEYWQPLHKVWITNPSVYVIS